jgi:CheY-like chemotaxis protein
MARKSVLVVDDHPDTGEVLSRLLNRRGYDAVAAFSGEEALARLAESLPSVIVLDVAMPGMNGAELLREIRADPRLKDVPVVVFSADFTLERMRELMALGAQEYLVKGTAGWDTVLARITSYAIAPKDSRPPNRDLLH